MQNCLYYNYFELEEINTSTAELIDVSGTLIDLTGKRMKQFYQRMLKDAGFNITVDQFIILQVLNVEDGLPQNELGNRTFKDKPTMTRILDLMVQKNLVKKVPNQLDKRITNVYYTTEGKQLIEEVQPVLINFRKIAWNGLSKDQMRQLLSLLEQICDNLKR